MNIRDTKIWDMARTCKHKIFDKYPPDSFYKSYNELEIFIKENPDYIGARLLFVNLSNDRQYGLLTEYFIKYINNCNKRGIRTIMIGDKLYSETDETVSQKLGTKFISRHYAYVRRKDNYGKIKKEDTVLLDDITDNEKKLAEDCTRQFYEDHPGNKKQYVEKFLIELEYLKKLFELIKPSLVLNWYDVYLRRQLKYLCELYDVPFLLMDYGAFVGTFLVMENGFNSESNYFKNPKALLNKDLNENDWEYYNNVLKYISQNEMETVISRDDAKEISEIKDIQSNGKPIIFLIGTDDNGVREEFSDDLKEFKDNIGRCYLNSQEAATDISQICKRNGWNFIFKPHPAFHNNDGNGVNPELLAPGSVYIVNLIIDKIIKSSDVIISFASNADYKSILNGKPVVSIGTNLINTFGCCYVAKNRTDVENEIRLALRDGLTETMKDNFNNVYTRLLKYNSWDNLDERSMRYGNDVSVDYFDLHKNVKIQKKK